MRTLLLKRFNDWIAYDKKSVAGRAGGEQSSLPTFGLSTTRLAPRLLPGGIPGAEAPGLGLTGIFFPNGSFIKRR